MLLLRSHNYYRPQIPMLLMFAHVV